MSGDRESPLTALAEPELEARIAADLAGLTAAAADARIPGFVGLVLGGGYGRGEGGGVRRSSGWQASNDYDLFAVVRGLPRWRLPALRARLSDLGHRLEDRFEVEVELAPLRQEGLEKLPFTLMWCELLTGHRVLSGPPDLLAAAPKMSPDCLPLIEATHYLANRGALLLLAAVDDLPAERRWKFVHKAWLAVVAAALAVEGRFQVGYGRRMAEVEAGGGGSLEGVDRDLLLARGAESTAYRLAPTPAPTPPELSSREVEARDALLAAWRTVETFRLGGPLSDWESYTSTPRLLPARPATSLARQLRLLGLPGLWPARAAVEPPRGRVLRSLPRLLEKPTSSAAVARILGPARAWDAQARRCLELWRRT